MIDARVNFADPVRVAVAFVAAEADHGRAGAQIFNAAAPVLEWEAVKAQMLYLHGCLKITRRDA